MPAGSVLQQPGPDASSVLVATSDRLSRDRPRHRRRVDRGRRGDRPPEPAGPPRRAASTAPGPVASVPWPRTAATTSRHQPARHRVQRPGLPRQPRRDPAQRPRHRCGLGHRLRRADPPRQLGRLQEPGDRGGPERGGRAGGPRRPAAAGGQARLARAPASAAPPCCTRSTTTPRPRAGCSRSGRCRTCRTADAERRPSAPTARPCRSGCPTTPRRTTFEYYIDDGREVSAHATVTVTPTRRLRQRAARSCARASSRASGRCRRAAPSTYPCCPTGATTQDGDPLSLESATRGPEASAPAPWRAPRPAAGSASPRPARAGLVTVEYAVADGFGEAVDAGAQVPGPGQAGPPGLSPPRPSPTSSPARPASRSRSARSPTTCPAPTRSRPSAVRAARRQGRRDRRRRGEHRPGRRHHHVPVQTRPRPSSSTTAPSSATRRSTRAGSGSTCAPPERPPRDPVAVPDSLTLYGQSAALVDVLANDIDPAGGMLVVQERRAGGRQPARRRGRRRPLAADLRPAGPAPAQPADRPLLHQQRHPLGRPGRGRGHPATGARRTTRR